MEHNWRLHLLFKLDGLFQEGGGQRVMCKVNTTHKFGFLGPGHSHLLMGLMMFDVDVVTILALCCQ